jgi:hypothetical protein
MWFFYGLDYAFGYACFYDTSMGHYTWYLVPSNELSLTAAARPPAAGLVAVVQGPLKVPNILCVENVCVYASRRCSVARTANLFGITFYRIPATKNLVLRKKAAQRVAEANA